MNVLVTGANGQLAKTLKTLYFDNSKGINLVFVTKEELSIDNKQEVLGYFKKLEFAYCINCAAYTNVDMAETDRDAAFTINDCALDNLINGCLLNDTLLIHISTDYVFDGTSNQPYKEMDEVNPKNIYGLSKLNGEKRIIKSMARYFIVRTSWLYSAYGKNFAKTISQKISNNDDLTIITSQKGVPTSCIDLSNFIFTLITTYHKDYGIYHFCPNGETTWHGFARQIALNYPAYDIKKLKPIDYFETKAARPEYSVMDNSKAAEIFKMREWEKGVDEIVELLKNL